MIVTMTTEIRKKKMSTQSSHDKAEGKGCSKVEVSRQVVKI